MMEIAFNNYRIPVVLKTMDEGDFGQFYFFPYPEIHVNKALKEEVLTSTILHEVIEMVSSIYGLNLEESQVRTLEVSLMAVFFQNPWFVDRLRQGREIRITDLGDWPPSQTLPDSPEAL
jgi:hypothetical protein